MNSRTHGRFGALRRLTSLWVVLWVLVSCLSACPQAAIIDPDDLSGTGVGNPVLGKLRLALRSSQPERLGLSDSSEAPVSITAATFDLESIALWFAPDCESETPSQLISLEETRDLVAETRVSFPVSLREGELCRARLRVGGEAIPLRLELAGERALAVEVLATVSFDWELLEAGERRAVTPSSVVDVSVDAHAWLPLLVSSTGVTAASAEVDGEVLASAATLVVDDEDAAPEAAASVAAANCGERDAPCIPEGANPFPALEGVVINALIDTGTVQLCASDFAGAGSAPTPLAVELAPLERAFFRFPSNNFTLQVFIADDDPLTLPCSGDQTLAFVTPYDDEALADAPGGVMPWVLAGETTRTTDEDAPIFLSSHAVTPVPEAGEAALRLLHALTGVAPGDEGEVDLSIALDASNTFSAPDLLFSRALFVTRTDYVGNALRIDAVATPATGARFGATLLHDDAGPQPRALAVMAGDLREGGDDDATFAPTLLYLALDEPRRGTLLSQPLQAGFPALP